MRQSRRFEQHQELSIINNKPEIQHGIEFLRKNTKQWSKAKFSEENQTIQEKLSENTNLESLQKVQKEIKEFYSYVKNIILDTENDNMAQMSHHYLTKQGKLVRPTLHLLLGNILYDRKQKQLREQQQRENSQDIKEQIAFQDSPEFSSQKIWAGVIELVHISSLIHDDIIDNATLRRGLQTSHFLYGKKQSTFSANWIIGRSGRKIAQLNNLHMFQLYSEIMTDLTQGEYIQAQQDKNYSEEYLQLLVNSYMQKTYYKTAALMAHSLRGVVLLNNEIMNQDLTQEYCFKFGQNIGIAFQLIDDILDFTQDAAQLGKQNLADVREGNITGPILFLLEESQKSEDFPFLTSLLKKKSLTDQEVNHIDRLVKKSYGLEKTLYLALVHIERALYFLDLLKIEQSSLPYQSLKAIALKIIQRTK